MSRVLRRMSDRLKAARAPSRTLDRELHRLLIGTSTLVWNVPRYTESLDVAIKLLPRVTFVEITGGTDNIQDGVWPAVSLRWLRPGQTDPKKWQGTVQGAPSFALAMCLAAVEIRERLTDLGKIT